MRAVSLVLLLASACGDSENRPASTTPDAGPAGCNPLIGDDCLTPFPSSFHEIADSTTATGVRVNLTDAVMPVNNGGVPIHTDKMNARDGFSPSTQFLAYFAAGVDATQLPTIDQLDVSVTAASAVQILDYATGERVPVMAELDANAKPGERQALMIHPMKRLLPATRYVIALVGLRDATGKVLAPASFVALRDGGTLDDRLAPLAPRYAEIFTALETAGVPRASLSLAWDVITASDATATGHLVKMRDESLAMAGSLTYAITSSTDTPADPDRLREVLATIQVPSYLTSDQPDATMNFGPDGQPLFRALHDVPVVIEIPQCATTAAGPLPFVVFGHGLFGNALQTLETRELLGYANRLCMIIIGTDWTGLASFDLGTILNEVIPDLNNIGIITDRLQQAHLNAQIMTRLFATKLKDDAALAYGGHPISDGLTAYYFGVSNGGIQGGTFMALSEDVQRGILDVAGGFWSIMIFRSGEFNALAPLLAIIYKDPLDRQALITASQSEWDYADPASFATHLLQDPLAGSPVKKILLHESIGDAQVPNLATRAMVRTIGLTGLDLEQHPYGITEAAGPLDSAYTQWDIQPTPLPPTSDTALPNDNGAHGGIQQIPELEDQIASFLSPTGQVVSTCHGPCIYPH